MSNCCGTVIPARTRWAADTPAFETRSVRIANRFTIEDQPARLHTCLTGVSLRSVHVELDMDTGPLRARVRPVRLARRHRRRRRRDCALGPGDRGAPARRLALLLAPFSLRLPGGSPRMSSATTPAPLLRTGPKG